MNARKMAHMMRKMGIAQEEVDATQVIIKCSDREIIINSPSVSKVKAMGQETFQISGEIEEKEFNTAPTAPEITSEDIKTVAEQANVSEEEAKTALENADGNIAKAILDLKKE